MQLFNAFVSCTSGGLEMHQTTLEVVYPATSFNIRKSSAAQSSDITWLICIFTGFAFTSETVVFLLYLSAVSLALTKCSSCSSFPHFILSLVFDFHCDWTVPLRGYSGPLSITNRPCPIWDDHSGLVSLFHCLQTTLLSQFWKTGIYLPSLFQPTLLIPCRQPGRGLFIWKSRYSHIDYPSLRTWTTHFHLLSIPSFLILVFARMFLGFLAGELPRLSASVNSSLSQLNNYKTNHGWHH